MRWNTNNSNWTINFASVYTRRLASRWGPIIHKLFLETNTVTPLLQRMEKAGLVKRTKGKEDTRQRIVSLTKKGIEMREQAKHIPECLSNEIIQITGEEEEFVRMIPTLDKLIEGLKQNNQQSTIKQINNQQLNN